METGLNIYIHIYITGPFPGIQILQFEKKKKKSQTTTAFHSGASLCSFNILGAIYCWGQQDVLYVEAACFPSSWLYVFNPGSSWWRDTGELCLLVFLINGLSLIRKSGSWPLTAWLRPHPLWACRVNATCRHRPTGSACRVLIYTPDIHSLTHVWSTESH